MTFRMADEYPEGRCPDCGEEINPEADEGDECENCGHVFWMERDIDEE